MPLDPKQIAARSRGIGASEIGAVMGVDPFGSAIDIWLRKTGRAPGYAGNSRMRAGHYMENPILTMFSDEMQSLILHPRDVFLDSVEGSVQHPDYPYILATPDGITIPRALGNIGTAYHLSQIALQEGHCVDAKNISLFGRAEWDGGSIPASYHLQVMQQMDVTMLRTYGFLAVLSGGQHFFYRIVEYDEEVADMIRDAATRFWFDYVLADTPPPVDASEGWAKWLERRLPNTLGEVVAAPPEAQELIDQIVKAKETIASASEEKDLAENKLKALIGDNRGMRGRGWKATWTAPGTAVSWKEIATELKAPQELIEKHTAKTDRRFRVDCKGDKGDKGE